MKDKKEKKNSVPFSKKNIIYARFEAYIFTIALIVLVFLDKDISAIGAAMLSLSWGGYKALQMFYIKMAEREHLEEIRHNRRLEHIDTCDIDEKIEELESTTVDDDLENDDYDY